MAIDQTRQQGGTGGVDADAGEAREPIGRRNSGDTPPTDHHSVTVKQSAAHIENFAANK